MSPEVQSRDISGPTKRTCVLQKLKKKYKRNTIPKSSLQCKIMNRNSEGKYTVELHYEFNNRTFTWIYQVRACGGILHRKSIKNLQMFSSKVSSHFGITSISSYFRSELSLTSSLSVSEDPLTRGEKSEKMSLAHQFLNYTFNEEVTKTKVVVFSHGPDGRRSLECLECLDCSNDLTTHLQT